MDSFGVCWGDSWKLPLSSYATVDTSAVRWGNGLCHTGRRRMMTAGVPDGCRAFMPICHAVCPHNEYASLALRTLGPLPEQVFMPVVSRGVLRAFARFRSLACRYGGARWSLHDTAMSYEGRLRSRYLAAEESLRAFPVRGLDARLRPFLKCEKVPAGGSGKPRMIFPRDPRYNLELASYLKPFEHWLWGRLVASELGVPGTGRVVAKGLNPQQRAALILKKFGAVPDCVVVEVDGRAFEAHVGPSLLEHEHRVYKAAYGGARKLSWLLSWQMVLEGRTEAGVEFSRPGGRASGDFNTGMGNSLVFLAVVAGSMNIAGSWDILVDGDNALLFLPGTSAGRVMRELPDRVLASSGVELTLERPVTVFEEVRFGRSAPVFIDGRPRMLRPPCRLMSLATSSHVWLREPRFAVEWLRGVGLCELSLALGVPVYQEFALRLLRLTEQVTRVRAHPYSDYFFLGARFAEAWEARPVSRASRESFARAFGVTPREQERLESAIRGSQDLGLGCRLLHSSVSFDPELEPFAWYREIWPGLSCC